MLQIFFSDLSHYSNSSKYVVLKISRDLQKNTCAGVSFLTKPQAACNYIKNETVAQIFLWSL